jgi:methyltransferase (TIGR00027 family)
LVAGINALFRSREAQVPASVRLLNDPYARLFGEQHPLIWTLRALRLLLPSLRKMVDELQIAHCVRHRSIDELCLQAGRDGFRQFVLLGAGYDTRALRLAEHLPHANWIEVDHPATATRKAWLIRRAGVDWSARRIALDFRGDDLGVALARSEFDDTQLTCFVLEGLVHYLDSATLMRLLDAMAGGQGARRIILSYIPAEMAKRASGLFRRTVALLREVPATSLELRDLAVFAHSRALTIAGNWNFTEQVEQFVRTVPRYQPQLSQDIAVLDSLKSRVLEEL